MCSTSCRPEVNPVVYACRKQFVWKFSQSMEKGRCKSEGVGKWTGGNFRHPKLHPLPPLPPGQILALPLVRVGRRWKGRESQVYCCVNRITDKIDTNWFILCTWVHTSSFFSYSREQALENFEWSSLLLNHVCREKEQMCVLNLNVFWMFAPIWGKKDHLCYI